MLFLRVDASGLCADGNGCSKLDATTRFTRACGETQQSVPKGAGKLDLTARLLRAALYTSVRPNGPQRSLPLLPASAPTSQLLWSTATTLTAGLPIRRRCCHKTMRT